MAKPTLRIRGRDGAQTIADGLLQGGPKPGFGRPQKCFQFAPSHLDGIEAAHFPLFMRGQVVHHDDWAGPQRGS
jgi:hypothetical protein